MPANPYSDTGFFEFFGILLQRLALLFYSPSSFHIAADELQIAVLACVGISGALVGPFLILRRMTMLANALSHTILLGIVAVFLLTSSDSLQSSMPLFLIAAIITGLATSFITEFLTTTLRLQADASTGLTFTSLFALGIVLVTLLTRNAHIGAEVVMGNVDALQTDDLKWAAIIAMANAALVWFFYKEYVITTFDKGLAAALGFSPLLFSYLLMGQVSLTVVSGFRAVGVLMVLALITAPALIARLITHKLHALIFWGIAMSTLGALIGVALSRHLLSVNNIALSTSGVTVCVLTLLFLFAAIWNAGSSLLSFRSKR